MRNDLQERKMHFLRKQETKEGKRTWQEGKKGLRKSYKVCVNPRWGKMSHLSDKLCNLSYLSRCSAGGTFLTTNLQPSGGFPGPEAPKTHKSRENFVGGKKVKKSKKNFGF